MEAFFKINKLNNCTIEIVSLERQYNLYISLEDFAKTFIPREYPYEMSITLNVITSIDSEGTNTIQFNEVIPHILDGAEISKHSLNIDGIHNISHYILPTKTYVENIITSGNVDNYCYLYYWDEDDKKLKLHTKDKEIIVSIEELINFNENTIGPSGTVTTIIKKDLILFNTCVLAECLYRLNRNMLSNFCGKCINKLDYSKLDIYNRDLIWMSINVIKYLVDMENYIEALRILESINTCGNICAHVITSEKGGIDCGCRN